MEVCGFGYKVVCAEEPKHTKPAVIYRGEDAAAKLIECLLKEQEEIESILSTVQPMHLSDEKTMKAWEATNCCICKKEFTLYDKLYSRIVFHHCHVSARFIGLAHSSPCNLNCKQAKHTCVIFHNLKNFDAHIICQNIGKFKAYNLRCIAQNTERYVSFSLGNLRFIDSFQFLPFSLEALVDNLSNDGMNAFPHFLDEFDIGEANVKLLLRKGVYPYDHMDSEDRFKETSLPGKEAFFSNIKREGISDEDHAHAREVFETFSIKNLGEYHDLYLKTDVILLCDVFEQFRNTCMKQYELDPCHFYTSPGLSWSACLKKSGVSLELLKDIDQILFIERGIRGGYSTISNRYKEANSPYLNAYDSCKPTSSLQYLDMNNLYGYAMIQKLPIGSFRFLSPAEIRKFNIHSIAKDGDMGYILDVSLKYPERLHDLHNDYPLAPERTVIKDEMLSPYAQSLIKNCIIKRRMKIYQTGGK